MTTRGLRLIPCILSVSAIAIALALVCARPALAATSQRASGPTTAQIKAEARHVGAEVSGKTNQMRHVVVRDTHAAGRQFRQAGRALHDDVHRFGRAFHHWWNRVASRAT